jgi:hypothetical protein
MKSRPYIVMLAACAAAALGTSAAQAQLLSNDSSNASFKSASSQSTLAAMLTAGTNYHGTARTHKTQTSVRPDDRSGPRGI